MKKTLLLSVMIAAVATLMAQEQKEVMIGASYMDEAYYSLDSGTIETVLRPTWDLGFTTSNFSASILANTAAGVEVYTYPAGDTADWAILDTTGMMWTPMYNSLETFDEGAFSANQTGHPDYGWGTYNMSTHNLTGDSLYVIKTLNGTYKKLCIIMRGSMANTWEFKYANLDGTEEQLVLLNSGDYNTKSFVYYSIDNNLVLDREPATARWDMLFTKYTGMISMGPGAPVPYPVTGILTNEDHIFAQEVRADGMVKSTSGIFEDTAFSTNISIIGSDWKSFDMGTMSYEVDSTIVYYLKKKFDETDSTYYKIYFTGFEMSMGLFTFMQEKMSLVSARSPEMIQMLEVYPNPASNNLNVVFDQVGETSIQVIDMTGRSVYSTIHSAGGFTNLSLDIAQLNPGLFFLKVSSGSRTGVIRFIKQ